MLQYLVILLDDTSVAYCHADNPYKERRLMSLETLKKSILFGMKHNLMIQYVFPDYALPEEYATVIESIDNVKIYPVGKKPVTGLDYESEADVEVADTIPEQVKSKNLVLRLPFNEVLAKKDDIALLLVHGYRLNLCMTDVERFSDEQIESYKQVLAEWNSVLLKQYMDLGSPQFNLLTDRMMLEKMHNCEAGVSNITLAPDGKFYLCPAFYYSSPDNTVGDLEKGPDISNPQLLQLDHAPLCRKCDAYQCRRCIWLNNKLTWDNNTPSHQQCVMAHIERNASRELLNDIRKHGDFMPHIDIPEIDYLDPFDVRKDF